MTAEVGEKIILDKDSANPVTIALYVVNANGKSTTNENDLSLGARITYGSFRAEIGGDLSGDNTSNYIDVETGVASAVGRLDVYKVHHHCSSHSSNDAWLAATKPTIAIISAGDGNTYSHPTEDCVERLHSVGTKTYWTERGTGAIPVPGTDTISGTAIVSVDVGAGWYTVTHGTKADAYAIGGGVVTPGAGPGSSASFAWSKRSSMYHYSSCDWASRITAENLMTGTTPPNGKTLHHDCPTHH